MNKGGTNPPPKTEKQRIKPPAQNPDPAVEAARKKDDGLFALGMMAMTDSDSFLEACEKLYVRVEEQKAKLVAKDERIAELERLIGVSQCRGPCCPVSQQNADLCLRIAELEETIRYWIAVDNRIVNNAVNPESRLAAKARIIAMKAALKAEE